jgi:hypothetical protein
VKSGAQLTAGGAINVIAHEIDTFKVITGQAAVGFVGAGASVAVVTIGSNVTAFAHGTLNAGGNINVNAILNENLNLLALDAAAGFVGIGAAVVVISDASLAQASLGNVTQAGDVFVTASNTRDLTENTGQVSTGAVAAGVSYTSLETSGGASATVDGGAQIGQSLVGAVNSLKVTAISTTTTHVHTLAISAGLVAVGVNFARDTDTAATTAAIGDGAKVTVTKGVTVEADSVDLVSPIMEGVTVISGVTVGLSFDKADVETKVHASIGNGSVNATTVTVTTTENSNPLPNGDPLPDGYGATTDNSSLSGPSLLTVGANISTAIMTVDMESKITGTVTASDTVTISAADNSSAVAKAHGLGLSGIGIAASETHADANGKVYAHLDGSVTTAKTLKISATGAEVANANSQAVVGGILAAADHDGATATVTPDIEAYVSSGGSINLTGNLEISALADPEADALTKGIGVSGAAYPVDSGSSIYSGYAGLMG